MTNSAVMYRLGIMPWEKYGASASLAAMLEREGIERPPGRALDVGCATLGTFGLFVDIGCFQGFGAAQRAAQGRSITAVANPGATLLMLAFGPTALRRWIGGVSQQEVEAAFPAWTLLSAEPAPSDGLGWPMNRTSPRWYRLRLS